MTAADRGSVRVLWPDGTLDDAGSWKELLDRVGMNMWDTGTRPEIRAELRRRAIRWSMTIVPAVGTDRQFFAELERAGMCTILAGRDLES